MAGTRLVEFAGWLAREVFDLVGTIGVAGVAGADGGDSVELQVGKTVFHGVPAKMRTELWLSQLHRKTADGPAPTAGQYYDLLFEKLSPEVLAEIDKDTHRTFPGHTWLSSPVGQKAMLNVLRAYALSDPEIGYTQGMNFLAGLLLTYLPSEADAYAALSLLMRQRGLREMYLPDMSVLQIRLWQLSKLLPQRLAAHLEAHAALPVLYASSWLLTCFAADFPIHFAARVMDVLLTGPAAASPILKVAVGIVARCEAALLRLHDFEHIVNYLRQEVPQWPKADLQDLLTDALSKPWSARQLRVLDQINGAETVMEAVARVNRLGSQSTSEAAEVPAALDSCASSAAPSPQPVSSAAEQEQQPEAPDAGDGGSQQQQQSGQLTPKTVARTLSSGLRLSKPPLRPPGRAKLTVPKHLEALPAQKVQIERSIADGDSLHLDPQFSRALSAYSPASSQEASLGGRAPSVGGTASKAAGPAPQQGVASVGREAFAQQSTQLRGAPSPFHGGSQPSSPLPPSIQQQRQPGSQPATPPAAGAEPAQSGGGQYHSLSGQGTASDMAAASTAYSSVQLDTLTSALPLVDGGEQRQQQGAAPAGSAAAGSGGALNPFLGLFGRSPGGGSGQDSHDGGPPAQETGSDLLQDAPSSTGSSLAAVLNALSLSATHDTSQSGAGPAAAGAARGVGGAAGAGGSWSQHSSDLEDWSSFKTAAAYSETSDDAGRQQSGSSFTTATAHSERSDGVGRQHSVSSSGSMPHHPSMHGSGYAPSGGMSTPTRQLSAAEPQQGRRLSGHAATQRASSLQEEQLQGFLSSGKKDASKKG